MTEIIFTPDACGDIVEAYSWYEAREVGLGEDFLRRLEASLSAIQRHTEMYPVAAVGFRRALMRRFPYEIFYEPGENSISVCSVFHCSQDPEKWRTRLGV